MVCVWDMVITFNAAAYNYKNFLKNFRSWTGWQYGDLFEIIKKKKKHGARCIILLNFYILSKLVRAQQKNDKAE